MMHVVDMYPTFAALAGAHPGENEPLDGIDIWSTISAGARSPRQEIVYNIEPYRGAVREGDIKLVWTPLLPPTVELFDLANDPGETTNLASQMPESVSELQARIVELAKQAAPPLFLREMVRLGLSVKPEFPDIGLIYD